MKTLELEIEGRNLLKDAINKELSHILPQLNQFIGKKFYNVDNSIIKAANFTYSGQQLENINTDAGRTQYRSIQSIYLERSYTTLWLNVSICINAGNYEVKPATAYCEYFKNKIYLGEVDGQVIKSLQEIENIIQSNDLNNPLNIQQVEKDIASYKQLKEQTEAAKNKLKGINEYFYKY